MTGRRLAAISKPLQPPFRRLIRSLFDRGVKPRYIARIVTDLNRKLFRRVFERLTPPALRNDVCLIVMGSEGRGEQLLRTDQDNGLIFRDAPADDERAATAEPFTRTLIDLGYPPCPGNVMVTNAEWSKTLAGYRQKCGTGWRSLRATRFSSSPFSMTPPRRRRRRDC